jgi:type III secretion protein R
VLVPSFTLTELIKAFQIGFVLYIVFVVVDLVVANLLLALGMQMISPTTISVPFKLLLFVMLDGWSVLIHGLVLSYR